VKKLLNRVTISQILSRFSISRTNLSANPIVSRCLQSWHDFRFSCNLNLKPIYNINIYKILSLWSRPCSSYQLVNKIPQISSEVFVEFGTELARIIVGGRVMVIYRFWNDLWLKDVGRLRIWILYLWALLLLMTFWLKSEREYEKCGEIWRKDKRK